jgi:glycosyltransferase involved in cell wall biosynthesis
MITLPADVPIVLYMPAFHGGGAENAIARLSNYWCTIGRRVTIVVNKANGPVRQRLDQRVEVVELGTVNYLGALPRLGRWLAERRVPLLVTALLGPCVAGLVAARHWSPATVVVSLVRNHLSEEFANRDPVRRFLLPPMLKYALRRSDAIGCVASCVSRDVSKVAGISPAKVHTTLNPVPLPDPDSIGARPDDMPRGRLLVAVGRLVRQKDYPTLIKALAKVPEAPDLVILGDGPMRSAIAQLAEALGLSGRVHLLGFKTNPSDYVAHADVFVLTSRFEGFPNVLAEALALGRTVVATDAPGGTAEILQNGAFGYLAPVGDVDAVARAIQRALEQPVAQTEARSRAAEFRVENVAGLYESLLATALQRSVAA